MELAHTPTPSAAPGCYSSPSVYSQDSDICRSCPTFGECAQACMETLQALRDQINVEHLLARHKNARQATIEAAAPTERAPINFHKFLPSVKKPEQRVERKVRAEAAVHDVSPEDQAIIGTLNKKSQELAVTWCKRGLIAKIRDDMLEGRNPFASEARLSHCGVVCDELLKGTVTKQSLMKAFMSRLGAKAPWDKSTASAHVGIAMPVLVAFGIAIETPNGFALNPASSDDNV
jgi:hypothetical protein